MPMPVVLIVDDNALEGVYLASALRVAGYAALLALDGPEAMGLLQRIESLAVVIVARRLLTSELRNNLAGRRPQGVFEIGAWDEPAAAGGRQRPLDPTTLIHRVAQVLTA